MKLCAITCLTLAMGLPQVLSFPADEKPQTDFGNLKFTFGNKDEVPAAFFESEPLKSPSNTTTPSTSSVQKRAYPACQDGSGGMCVDAGTCPSSLRPESSSPNACSSGQECCFGASVGDQSCASRGGECRPQKECGAAPTFDAAKDCDKKSGQVCCVLI